MRISLLTAATISGVSPGETSLRICAPWGLVIVSSSQSRKSPTVRCEMTAKAAAS
ncbi:Uncharacterised protein [Mycobacteroides abscessus subsp. abscessus]|nr:Uncharacterised protein [Mycobacteroides abscessus subsp. abscessus]